MANNLTHLKCDNIVFLRNNKDSCNEIKKEILGLNMAINDFSFFYYSIERSQLDNSTHSEFNDMAGYSAFN